MQLEEIRRDYKRAALSEDNIHTSPTEQFTKWMNEALAANIPDATAMSLVSIGNNGYPQSRIVLLKDFGVGGFTFFTNYKSEKGRAIERNNKVGLHFFWPELERQIRISGLAVKTDSETSKKYFHSRPQNSQIAASISEQSSVIRSRDFLEFRFKQLTENLNGSPPQFPKNWGGYVVSPEYFEFWQGRESRLHDRIVYEKDGAKWIIKRLAP